MSHDPARTLNALRRPALILRAARHGLADYRRERDLRRLLKSPQTPPPARALAELMAREAEIEATRCEGNHSYSFSRHVDLLIALLAEARLAGQLRPAPAS